MKITVFVVLIFLYCAPAYTQINFTRSETFNESFEQIAPLFIKKGDHLYLLKISGSKITQLKLDASLHLLAEQTFNLKGIKCVKFFAIENDLYLLGINKDDSFNIYSYDAETGTPSPKISFNLAEEGVIKSTTISVVETSVGDGVGLIIKLDDTNPVREHVVMLSAAMDTIHWQKVLVTPEPMKSDAGRMKMEFTEISFHSAKEMKVCVLTKIIRSDNELETDLYQFNGKELNEVWSMTQTMGTIEDKLQSLPIPFIHTNGEVQYYQIECDLKSGEVTLVLNDADHNEIKHFLLDSKFEELKNMRRVGVDCDVSSVGLNFQHGTFDFFIIEPLDTYIRTEDDKVSFKKTHVLRFKKNKEKIDEMGVITIDYYQGLMSEVNGFLIENGCMSYHNGTSKVNLNFKQIFDRRLAIVYPDNERIWHFVVDEEIYSVYSYYTELVKISQVVHWNFE